MQDAAGHLGGVAAGVVALLLVRGGGTALESALAAVGGARAEALAAAPGASARARALGVVLAAREATAASLQLLDAASGLGAGALAGLAGAAALPGLRPLGIALALLAALLLGMVLSSAARALGARHAEPVALALAPQLRRLSTLGGPLGRAAALASRPFLGGPGRFAPPPPPLEELERALAERARSAGTPSAQATSELIEAVFEFSGKVARDVMVPRTEVVGVDLGTPVPEILRLLAEEGHSRMPVYRESLDRVVGTLHARDLVPLMEHPGLIVLSDIVRPPHFVPWSKPIDQLLRDMQHRHIHMAVVVDEHGGVMGICTLEDVLEEIVGELRDEFEVEQGKGVEAHADGSYTVRADTPVEEFNRLVGGDLPLDGQYETVGGFLNLLAGAIPATGDRLYHRGLVFTVGEATPQRVLKVRVVRVKRGAEREGQPRRR